MYLRFSFLISCFIIMLHVLLFVSNIAYSSAVFQVFLFVDVIDL